MNEPVLRLVVGAVLVAGAVAVALVLQRRRADAPTQPALVAGARAARPG